MVPVFVSRFVPGQAPETSRAISSWEQPFVGAWLLTDFTVGSFQYLLVCTDAALGRRGAANFRSLVLWIEIVFEKNFEIQS